MPGIEEQGAIADLLEGVDRDIASMTRLQGLLECQKRGLMQQLLTGRLRVKV